MTSLNGSLPERLTMSFAQCELINHGDCREIVPTIPDDIIDAVIADPPYHLTTMRNPTGTPKCQREGPFKRLNRGLWIRNGMVAISHSVQMSWAEVYRVHEAGRPYRGIRSHSHPFHRVWLRSKMLDLRSGTCSSGCTGKDFPKAKNVALGIDKHFGHPNRGRRHPHGEHAAGRSKWCRLVWQSRATVSSAVGCSRRV